MSRTVIYRRQSLDRTGEGLGIDRQLKECQRVAKARSLKISTVLTDNSVSASKGGRPAYLQLIDMIKTGNVGTVIILRIDRLLRLNDELEELISLVERYPVRVVTVEGDVDISTPQGRLIARVLVSVARNEIEVKSARQKLANSQKAAAGKPHGSRRPYGYNADLMTLCEVEADTLRQMADRVMSGHAYNEIAYWLNQSGQRTTLGSLWYPVTVRNLLLKKRYAGIREHNGAEYPALWPAVFDAVTWERLQLTMRLRSEKNHIPGVGKLVSRKYLLTGLLHCGNCGNALNGVQKRDRADSPMRRVYYCRPTGDTQPTRGCGKLRRNADALDDYITEAVLYRLDTPDLGSLLADTGPDDAQLRLLLEDRQAQKLRLDALVDDYATGLLTREQLTRAKTTAEAELARLESELEAVNVTRSSTGLIPVGQTVRAAWTASESNEWRRVLLGLLIKRIVVNQGNTKPLYKGWRFDPKLIVVEWLA